MEIMTIPRQWYDFFLLLVIVITYYIVNISSKTYIYNFIKAIYEIMYILWVLFFILCTYNMLTIKKQIYVSNSHLMVT